MANASHVVPRLVAALPVTVLLWGCQSGGRQPFRFPEQPPAQASAAQGKAPHRKAPPALVEITSDCKASPERAVVNAKLINRWNPSSNALWHATDKQAGDRVVISAKENQDPKSRTLFQPRYEIPPSFNAIRSGSPKGAKRVVFHSKTSLVWQYTVDYYRDGKLLCSQDPEICIQKPGTNSCGTQN
ncbi:MAG TPA: hypothetical protein VIC28_08395 [Thermoanaerobaculia bacterium]|jgi:hypothetical protein